MMAAMFKPRENCAQVAKNANGCEDYVLAGIPMQYNDRPLGF